ncbi:MAG: hypothetical protein RL885_06195 [Planctomycetota bacterium]
MKHPGPPEDRRKRTRILTMIRGAIFAIFAALFTSLGHLGAWYLFLLPLLILAAAFPKKGERADFFIGAASVALLLERCFMPRWYL